MAQLTNKKAPYKLKKWSNMRFTLHWGRFRNVVTVLLCLNFPSVQFFTFWKQWNVLDCYLFTWPPCAQTRSSGWNLLMHLSRKRRGPYSKCKNVSLFTLFQCVINILVRYHDLTFTIILRCILKHLSLIETYSIETNITSMNVHLFRPMITISRWLWSLSSIAIIT